jgi:transcriptional regulator with XRE-family HTH domain
MSRGQLAKLCGVSRVAVGHWLRGTNLAGNGTLDRILSALKLTHAEFYGPVPVVSDRHAS